MLPPVTELRGVLLDVDGTLVDSNDAHATAWVSALAEFGYPVDFARVRRMIGMGGDKLLPGVTGLDAESALGKRIDARRGEIFLARCVPTLQAVPGARQLLERLRRDGLRLVVASSAKEEELNPLLERAGVADLFEARASSGDADRSKPDPDIIHAALRRAKLRSDEVYLIGDTPYDIEAAANAGVGTVAVRSGGWTDRDLHGAVAVYDHMADLLAHYDASVFASAATKS